MYLEKAYDRVVRMKLLEGIQTFYKKNIELNGYFDIRVGVRQECMMLPFLFSIFMFGCREKNLSYGMGWAVVVCLFMDYEGYFQRLVN